MSKVLVISIDSSIKRFIDLTLTHYDYLIKPFKFDVLKMKINRLMQMNLENVHVIKFGDFKIDVTCAQIRWGRGSEENEETA